MYIGGNGGEEFLGGIHGALGCTTCHGGVDGIDDKQQAHAGLVSDPSANAEEACGRCHVEAATNFAGSVHASFAGYRTFFEERAGLSFADHPEIEQEFLGECGACHATCGQCHVSRPVSVKGGLVQGHRFLPSPNQSENCTACHGSRVGEEYTGSRTGYAADVHYVPNAMNCMACHTSGEMHGDGTEYTRRYETAGMPRCEDCHAAAATANTWHSMHWGQLQCQACHSQDYKNCNACHVGGGGITGSSYLTFKIGKNPLSDLRGYEYVVLRHIPVTEDTFDPWGVSDLANYESMPTWKYASPHNIRRFTARTDTTGGVNGCDGCHDTPDEGGWFLRQADLDTLSAREAAANEALIVPDGSPFTWP